MAQSSPTEVMCAASGGSGTSAKARSNWISNAWIAVLTRTKHFALAKLLTHNFDIEGGRVLTHRIGHLDGVAPLI